MAAVSMRTPPRTACRRGRLLGAASLIALVICLFGCLHLSYEETREGAEVKPLPKEFLVGRTTLSDVLAFYGAPVRVVNMEGHFALLYQRAFYRGGRISLSIPVPINSVMRPSSQLDAKGNLQRYDAAVFIFKPDGVLSEMSYVKGTDLPLWSTYWQ